MTKSLETKRSFLSVSRIVLAVLMCLLFTGCALLDIKDKGGMVNPDAVSEEETGVAENETENDMSRFMKKKTETESDTEITADGDQPVRKPVRETMDGEIQKTVSSGTWMTETGKSALVEDREYVNQLSAAAGVYFIDYTADFTSGGRQEQVKILFPYLENLPADHRIECDGDEWYVIVPASENWTIAVNRNTWNENTFEDVKGEEIARISDGLPFLLRCNVSDLHSNVMLTAQNGNRSASWCPEYNLYAEEVLGNESFVALGVMNEFLNTGYLYNMEGSWYCDANVNDQGQPFFYNVSFLTDLAGNPTTIGYYGGLLVDGVQEIRFFWDGTYIRRTEPWEYEYWFNTPDGERTGTIRVEPDNDTVLIQNLGGESFFPYTGNDSAVFYYIPQDAYGEAAGEGAGDEGAAADLEYVTQVPEIHEKILQGMSIYEEESEEINGEPGRVYVLISDNGSQYVREGYYALTTKGVYRMDYLTGEWELIEGRGGNLMKEITLERLPATVEELAAMPQAALTVPEEVAALTVAALARFPENQEDAAQMLDFLRGPRPLNGIDKQFLKDRFRGKEYLMRSFFAGSSPENNYTPSMPYRVVVSENPYSRSQLAEGYLTLYVNCSGADSPRPLKLRKKPSTGQWFLWEQQLLAGIRIPAAADPWS